MNIDIVLCSVDFSGLAERELQLAAQICEQFNAQLVLHHNLSAIAPGFAKAWEWDQSHRRDERSAVDAERRIKALLAQLPKSIRAEAAITHGPVAMVLLALAKQLPADLLVLGTHGWSTADHASVTERIIECAPCPVLTIHDVDAVRAFRLGPGADGAAARVLVPTDFSPAATKALDYAVELARKRPIELHLVHVTPGPPTDDAVNALVNSVPTELKERVQVHLRTGRPLDEIDAVLQQVAPELIVMGTHARSFWRRLFTRDTARRVLHGANCPVLFVPPA